METAGTLQSYHYDEACKVYEMKYKAEKGGATTVFLPFKPEDIACDFPVQAEVRTYSSESWLVRVTAGADGEANLIIRG